MSKEFFSPATLPPPVGYSHVAKVNKGTLIYLAGQVSSDASGALVGEGNFEAQVEQVFANVKIAVEAAGATMADIVKMNTYLVAEVARPRCRKCGRSATATSTQESRRPARWWCQPSGAAGLADRDRGGGGARLIETKTAPARGAAVRSKSRVAAYIRDRALIPLQPCPS